MNLGLAIFLSALVISLVLLFNSTKDRWNWKKIIKTAGIPLLIILLALGIWYFVLPLLDYHIPELGTNFWDINLGSSEDDVRFSKGIPTEIDSINSCWLYNETEYSWRPITYKVCFDDNKVSSIVYYCTDWDYNAPTLSGRKFSGYNLQSIKDYFGEPTDVNPSKDGVRRIYSFKKYQVVCFLEENKVFGYGIYDPQHGTSYY